MQSSYISCGIGHSPVKPIKIEFSQDLDQFLTVWAVMALTHQSSFLEVDPEQHKNVLREVSSRLLVKEEDGKETQQNSPEDKDWLIQLPKTTEAEITQKYDLKEWLGE